MTSLLDFQNQIREGIPSTLPEKDEYDIFLNHAPKGKIFSIPMKKTH